MAEMMEIRDNYRLQQWSEIIRECQNSGMTVKAYCRQQGVSEKSYYYYLKKLRTMAVEASKVQLVQIEPPEEEKKPDLLHIRYKESQITVPIEIDMAVIIAILNSLKSL